jgi:hypothetical protein
MKHRYVGEKERMKKISAIIVALVTVLIVFAIIGSIVFVYPVIAGQQVTQLTLPSGQWVQYKQGGNLYSFRYIPYGSSLYNFNAEPALDVDADNFIPHISAFSPDVLSLITQGATYYALGMNITMTKVNSNYLVISISSSKTSAPSIWQATIIIYLTVIAILLAVIIVLLLLKKTKNR